MIALDQLYDVGFRLWVMFLIVVLILACGIPLFRMIKGKDRKRSNLGCLLWGVWLLGAVGFCALNEDWFNKLITHIQRENRTFVGTSFVVAIAVVLFELKRKALRVYAVLESFFAVIVATQTVASLTGHQVSPVQGLSLLTAAYLMIRGMDNFKNDWDERKKLSNLATNVIEASPSK